MQSSKISRAGMSGRHHMGWIRRLCISRRNHTMPDGLGYPGHGERPLPHSRCGGQLRDEGDKFLGTITYGGHGVVQQTAGRFMFSTSTR